MAKTLVIAGKIGPTFGGTEVTAYGSAHARETDRLDEVFDALAENVREGMAWWFDTYPLEPLNLASVRLCQHAASQA